MWTTRSRNTNKKWGAHFFRKGKALLARSLPKITLVLCTSAFANDTAIFIWNRGGAGHNSVKEARKSEWLADHKKSTIYDIDLFGDGFINDFCKLGDLSIKLWDGAQKDGNIARQKLFLDLLGVADVVFHPVIYYKTKKLLLGLEEEPSAIVSTQALGITPVVQAMREVNKKRGWNMHLDLQMIEMPTEQPTYIFKALKGIKDKTQLAKLVTLKTFKPFIKTDLTEEEFWRKYCGKIHVEVSDTFPVRKSFLSQESLLGKAVPLIFEQKHGSLSVPVGAEDTVVTLMLGSVPSKESVLSYLDAMIDLAKEPGPTTHFFIYTGREKNLLMKKILTRLEEDDVPEKLNVVPFTNQSEAKIAELLARSDVTLTRSGAATTMELLHLNSLQKKKATLIHAEGYGPKSVLKAKKQAIGKAAAVRSLLLENGINHWESGNAEYLEREIGAMITHPKYFRTHLYGILHN